MIEKISFIKDVLAVPQGIDKKENIADSMQWYGNGRDSVIKDSGQNISLRMR